jgi:hypothetical protein
VFCSLVIDAQDVAVDAAGVVAAAAGAGSRVLSLPEISPDVLMVQSSQERLGDDAADGLNRP